MAVAVIGAARHERLPIGNGHPLGRKRARRLSAPTVTTRSNRSHIDSADSRADQPRADHQPRSSCSKRAGGDADGQVVARRRDTIVDVVTADTSSEYNRARADRDAAVGRWRRCSSRRTAQCEVVAKHTSEFLSASAGRAPPSVEPKKKLEPPRGQRRERPPRTGCHLQAIRQTFKCNCSRWPSRQPRSGSTARTAAPIVGEALRPARGAAATVQQADTGLALDRSANGAGEYQLRELISHPSRTGCRERAEATCRDEELIAGGSRRRPSRRGRHRRVLSDVEIAEQGSQREAQPTARWSAIGSKEPMNAAPAADSDVSEASMPRQRSRSSGTTRDYDTLRICTPASSSNARNRDFGQSRAPEIE